MKRYFKMIEDMKYHVRDLVVTRTCAKYRPCKVCRMRGNLTPSAGRWVKFSFKTTFG